MVAKSTLVILLIGGSLICLTERCSASSSKVLWWFSNKSAKAQYKETSAFPWLPYTMLLDCPVPCGKCWQRRIFFYFDWWSRGAWRGGLSASHFISLICLGVKSICLLLMWTKKVTPVVMAIEFKIQKSFLLHVMLTRSWIKFQTNKTLLGVRAHSMRSFTSVSLRGDHKCMKGKGGIENCMWN